MDMPQSPVSQELPLNKIRPGRNPRTYFDQAELEQMAASMRSVGVIQPPLVRPIADTGEFELIAGEKRWRAAQLAGLTVMPVYIRNLDDAQAEAAAVIENVHRGNMSAAEEAKAAQKILFRNGGDKTETALALGWTVETLEKRLAILACAPPVLEALTQRKIQLGHAELLAAVPQDKQVTVLRKIIDGKLTVAVVKANLGQLAYRLADAIFDKTPCMTCPFNSARQAAMFAESIGDGYCTNPPHFDELTNAKLEEIARAQRDEFPTVRIVRKEDGFTPLYLTAHGALGVGVEQAQACKSCANYGCAISAAPGSVGAISKPLCFDAACNQKKVAARIQSEQASDGASPTASPRAANDAAGKRFTQAKPSAKPSAVPKAVAAYRVEQWRTMLARELHKQRGKAQSLLIALALTRNLTYVDQPRFRAALEKSHDDLPKAPTLVDAAEFTHDRIHTGAAEALALVPCAAAYGVPESDLVKLMAFLEVDVAAHWRLNKAFLDCLTKSEIETVADELGLKKRVAGGYARCAAGKKDELIKALLTIEGFDYAGVVPKIMSYGAKPRAAKGAQAAPPGEGAKTGNPAPVA